MPRPLVLGDDVVHAIRRRKAARRRKDGDALVRHGRTEIDDADHDAVVRSLVVTEEIVVLRFEEVDVVQVLQREILPPRRVQPLHQREERPVQRSLLRLVFLGIEVLLRALAHRHVLEALEPGVDAVRRRQRRREHEPSLERRPSAALEVLVK
jgi:hypothetical protein